MVPVNVWSAVFFMVLVAPGLLHDLMAETRTARQKESAFREVSRVVLASLAFSAAPLLAITALGDLGLTDLLPDPSEWADAGDAYAVDNYAAIVASLVLQCLLSCALVVAFHHFKHHADPRLAATPTWRKVFRDDNPTDAAPVVRVKTTTGSTYVGILADYSQTWDDDRDLVLAPPLQVKPDGGRLTPMPDDWQRVIIPSSSIQVVTVRYVSSSVLHDGAATSTEDPAVRTGASIEDPSPTTEVATSRLTSTGHSCAGTRTDPRLRRPLHKPGQPFQPRPSRARAVTGADSGRRRGLPHRTPGENG